jgi:hypothetical protein
MVKQFALRRDFLSPEERNLEGWLRELEVGATLQCEGGEKITFNEFIIQAEKIVQSFKGGAIVNDSQKACSHQDTADNESFEAANSLFICDLSNSYFFFILETHQWLIVFSEYEILRYHIDKHSYNTFFFWTRIWIWNGRQRWKLWKRKLPLNPPSLGIIINIGDFHP